MSTVQNGNYVKICYTAKLESGEVVDRTEKCQPLEVHVGSGDIIPGLENALIGMSPNEKKTITLGPDDAYGIRDDRLERSILRSSFDPGFEPSVGQIIAFRTPKGEQLPAIIKHIDGESVTVDFNHPLAGESLIYEVEVAEVADTPSQNPSMCDTGCCCS